MMRGRGLTCRAGLLLVAVLVTALALEPGAAAAMVSAPGEDGLSPRLVELAKPALRSAPPAEQAAALSLAAEGPGSLLREGRRVLVEVRFDRGAAAAVEDLRTAGAKIVNVSRRYQTVTVAAKPAQLWAVGAVSRVRDVTEILAPILAATECHGLATSEGDSQLSAANARNAFGVDGSGVSVGILSDSFDEDPGAATHASGDVASGDLPGSGNPCGHSTPVHVLDDSAQSGEVADEGRAMAQTVHDLAPGASLSFATAFNGPISFAENIRALRAAGASVIADDVFYPEEPFFQDGPIADAINEVTAGGVAYFSAVGNDNLIDSTGRDIDSWEAPEYRDSGSCPAAIVTLSEEVKAEEGGVGPGLNASHCMDFDPGAGKDETFGITVSNGAKLTVDLQWAEPWQGVETDLDAFLLDEEGKLAEGEIEGKKFPVGSTEDNVNGSEEPFESFGWENDTGESTTVQLVINRFSGVSPRLKVALLQNGRGVTETEYPESSGGDTVGPTIFGHSGASSAVGVGAVRFNDSSKPEFYSSRGPLTHYFGPVTGITPAKPIAPQTISKPDVVATDCGATTFFAFLEAGTWRFCGTSAAAPHAAAVAALMKQANPSLSYAQLRGALAATARPVGAFGPDAVGAGLIDAYGAVSSVALPPTISITERPPALSKLRRPSIGFTANRPVTFTCSIDGGGLQSCSSPFVPSAPLADGVHGFVVRGVDAAGRAGTSEVVGFKIDSRRPRTFFRRHPHKTIRTHHRRAKAVFRFGSNERGVTFACKVDAGFQRFCKPRFVKRFRVGRHVVWVKARDAAGNVDRSPAVFRFTVKHVG